MLNEINVFLDNRNANVIEVDKLILQLKWSKKMHAVLAPHIETRGIDLKINFTTKMIKKDACCLSSTHWNIFPCHTTQVLSVFHRSGVLFILSELL